MLVLLLSACAYEVPYDPDGETINNVLSGSVVVSGTDELSDVVVLLFDANDPPPPLGIGRPVNFATVPASAFTGPGAGIQAAPWAITGVPDGDWLVSALMDTDHDFHPLLDSNAGTTCGDWVGAHVTDLTTGEIATIHVEGGVLMDDITVGIGIEVTTERPAFVFDTSTVDQNDAANQTFTLSSTGIHSELVDLADPYDGTDPCGTMFLYLVPDADGNGFPDAHHNADYAAQGVPEIWPRIYLQYLGDDVPEGESWASEAVPSPTPYFLGLAPLGVVTPVTSLDVVFAPAAIHTLADGTEELVQSPDQIPVGPWSVTVIQYGTGQTWTVPNEVADYGATRDDFDPSLQGGSLTVE
jgi:hypothetical protein